MLPNLRTEFARLFSPIRLTIWVVGSALTALAGPFETYAIHGFPARFLYWFLILSISTILAGFCSQWLNHLIGWKRPVLFDVTKVAFMVVVFTPILFVLTHVFRYGNVQFDSNFVIYVQSVAAITATVCIARRVLPGFEEIPYGKAKTQDPTLSEPHIAEPRLTRRLPADYEGPILRLSVRDHFVDVVTLKSTHTIRLRFSDAIDEMDDVEGYCTHRSHWVSHSAILQPERNSGRIFLRISNQDLVPVSRKYKPELQAAGLV